MARTKTLWVKAADPERPCPKLRTRRGPIDKKTGRDMSMIYFDEAVEVPNVRYYRQRIRKGDLAEAATLGEKSTEPAPKPKTKAKTKASKE